MTIKTSFLNILVGSAIFWVAFFSIYFSSDVKVVAFPSGKAVFIVNGTETNCTINATSNRNSSDLEADFEVCLQEFKKYKEEGQ